jgi:hypothetical protein
MTEDELDPLPADMMRKRHYHGHDDIPPAPAIDQYRRGPGFTRDDASMNAVERDRAVIARIGGNLYRRRVNANIRTQPGFYADEARMAEPVLGARSRCVSPVLRGTDVAGSGLLMADLPRGDDRRGLRCLVGAGIASRGGHSRHASALRWADRDTATGWRHRPQWLCQRRAVHARLLSPRPAGLPRLRTVPRTGIRRVRHRAIPEGVTLTWTTGAPRCWSLPWY